jgi:hypothetical protein
VQHQEDIQWFNDHPEARWRVRPRVPGEYEDAVGSTHMVVSYTVPDGLWTGKPLYAVSDDDAYERGAVEMFKLFTGANAEAP